MPLFQLKDGKAVQLNPDAKTFRAENDLHTFFEANLFELLNITLIAREYTINDHSGRIDTLGLDEINRPVIIEYKVDMAGDEVLAQGLSYFGFLNENRSHFELLAAKVLQRQDYRIDWQQPRLVFVAKRFSDRLVTAAKFSKIPSVDLIRYSTFEDNVMILDIIVGQQTQLTRLAPSTPETNLKPPKDNNEVGGYLSQTRQEFQQPFRALREALIGLDGIKEVIQPKVGITYYTIKAIARFEFGKSYINLLVKGGAANDDPQKRLRDIANHKVGFPYLFQISSVDDFEYAKHLLQAAYSDMR